MRLLLTDVRCFKGEHAISLAPLTFLVGENSTGKSTILAMLDAVLALALGDEPTFNKAPYDLGQFRSIATYESESFGLGLTSGGDKDDEKGLMVTFRDDSGQPRLSRRKSWNSFGELDVHVEPEAQEATVELRLRGGEAFSKKLTQRDAYLISGTSRIPILEFLHFYVRHELISDKVRSDRDAYGRVLAIMDPFGRWADSHSRGPTATITTPPLSLAPVRTKPRRTYDQALDTYSPEGDHIPLILAKTLRRGPNKESPIKLVRGIRNFGLDSGLFRNVRIKRLGRTAGDPFQLNVIVAGRPHNLTDVGYGVSQCLPIVVQSILTDEGRTLLIQQPEVHLHPKAQAALGSLLVGLSTFEKKRFIVETHSDYLVDRVRRCIGKGEIPATDVSLLFLEKNGQSTTVHRIGLDDKGSITAAPFSYRRFFVDEEFQFLLDDGEQLVLFADKNPEHEATGRAVVGEGEAPPPS